MASSTGYGSLRTADIPLPAAIIDKSIVTRNCEVMLKAVRQLSKQQQQTSPNDGNGTRKVQFRAHVKTHKTADISRLQVGDDVSEPALFIASTLPEINGLAPLVLTYRAQGRDSNILYGVPLPPSQVARLAKVGKAMGPGSISVMIDHEDQLAALATFTKLAGFPARAFVKIVTGPPRAGRKPATAELDKVIQAVLDAESSGTVKLLGFYSHAGDSYYGSSEADATTRLASEIEQTYEVAKLAASKSAMSRSFVVAVGATPTATALHNLLNSESTSDTSPGNESVSSVRRLRSALDELTSSPHIFELHAGVFPTLDLQQLATRAQPDLSFARVGVTILAEVCSLYPEREEGPEAMIAAGCLALGREPCKSYKGWGAVSTWGIPVGSGGQEKLTIKENGWIVGRISQEHGILTRGSAIGDAPVDTSDYRIPFEIGQRVRIFPNHACIALAGYKSLVVVDSSIEGKEDDIQDVWESWHGW